MSVKDFNAGIMADASAAEAFNKKQGDALSKVAEEIKQIREEHGSIIEAIIDDQNHQQMENVFGISESLDIGKLGKSDQIKLLSYLKTLFTQRGQNTQEQQQYFFKVKEYLNITDVEDTMEFSSVSQLDISITEIKTFLQCVFEFMFLKTCTRKFVEEFAAEIGCFGVSERIIDEILVKIETVYEHFGAQGIIEHYSVKPDTQKEEETELSVKFFEKPIVVVYDGKKKHYGEYATMLKVQAEELLKHLGAKTPQISVIEESKIYSNQIGSKNHLVYIGLPKSAKNLLPSMEGKWEFDRFGIKFGTAGEQSIITVDHLKNHEREAFKKYLEDNESQLNTQISSIISSLDKTFLEGAYDVSEDEDKGAALVGLTVGTLVALPLVAVGAAVDAKDSAKQKEGRIRLQYFVAIERFLSSKIFPKKD